MLRPQDQTWLAERATAYRVTDQDDGTHLVLENVALPAGLEPLTTDILIILPPGFADVGPDMFWCFPAVTGTAGGVIPGTEGQHTEEGRTWQRWSRHIGNVLASGHRQPRHLSRLHPPGPHAGRHGSPGGCVSVGLAITRAELDRAGPLLDLGVESAGTAVGRLAGDTVLLGGIEWIGDEDYEAREPLRLAVRSTGWVPALTAAAAGWRSAGVRAHAPRRPGVLLRCR